MTDTAENTEKNSPSLLWLPTKIISLDSAEPLTIGRTDENSVVLIELEVSRRHAVIEHRGEQYVVIDLNSSNGVRVNGEKVTPNTEIPLNHWDTIKIGLQEFVFIDDHEADIEDTIDHHRNSRRNRATEIFMPDGAAERDSAFSGHLSEISPVELLQMLALGRKTGHLTISSKEALGELIMRDGLIINAVYAGLVDTEAVYELVPITKGLFEFTPQDVDKEASPVGSVAGLIMEGLRRCDERERIEAEQAEAEANADTSEDKEAEAIEDAEDIEDAEELDETIDEESNEEDNNKEQPIQDALTTKPMSAETLRDAYKQKTDKPEDDSETNESSESTDSKDSTDSDDSADSDASTNNDQNNEQNPTGAPDTVFL